jgi:transposase
VRLVPDEVWAAIQPLLPAKQPRPKGGRPWIEDRAVLGGIIDVVRARQPLISPLTTGLSL